MPRIDLGRVVGEVDTNTIIPFEPSEEYSAPMSGDMLGVFMGKVTTDLSIHDSAIGRSDAFSEEIDYTKGAYCVKEDMVYRFTDDKPKGAWDPEKVEPTNIITELTSMRQELSALNGKSQSGIFSYEETRIGTWIDGKPLYRKMINFGALPNNSTKDTPINVQDVDFCYVNLGHCLWVVGVYGQNKDTTFSPLYAYIESIYYRKIGNTPSVRAVTKTDYSEYSALICVEYTKTTDSPGQ